MLETDRSPLTRLGNTLVSATFAIGFVLAFSLFTGLAAFGRRNDGGGPFFGELAFRLWPTAQLIVASFLLALPFGFAASRVPAIGRVARAVPFFWLAMIAQLVVAMLYRGDPMTAFGMAASARFDVGDRLVHMLGPAGLLAFYQLPQVATLFRSRAAGIVTRPLVGALFGLFARRLPEVAGASIIAEIVFAWPGIGGIFITGLRTGDATVLAGVLGAVALVVLALRTIAGRDV